MYAAAAELENASLVAHMFDHRDLKRQILPCGAQRLPNGNTVVASYAAQGNVKVLEIPPFNTMGTPLQLIKQFGGKAGFEQAVHELQDALYASGTEKETA